MDGLDLDQAWRQIVDRLDREEVAMFPAFSGFVEAAGVEWQGDDWSAFLDVAVRVGCGLIYGAHEAITDDDLDRTEERIARGELEVTPDDRSALAAARGHVGEIVLGFAHGGVLHCWTSTASWFVDATEVVFFHEKPARSRRAMAEENADAALMAELDEVDREYDDLDLGETDDDGGRVGVSYTPSWRTTEEFEVARVAELERLGPQVDEWVEAIARHPDVLGAPNEQRRRELACRIVPELDEWTSSRVNRTLQTPEVQARQHIAYEVISQAEWRQGEEKVRRINDAKARIDEWAAELRRDPDFLDLRTVDEKRRRTSEFVTGKLGFMGADVRDRVLAAARKPPVEPPSLL
jgi:hypothetical protein